MSNFNMLILQSNESGLLDLHEFKMSNKFSLSLVTASANEAYQFVERFNVDSVIVELNTPTAEAYEFIDKLSFLPKRPLIAAVSALSEESYFTRARRLGARLTYKAPYNLEQIIDEINNTLRDEAAALSVRVLSDRVLDERLANIFISSGIPPHIKGYQYLREAVKQSVHNPSKINNITKELYPAVAQKFGTTASKVERAIRHAIEVAWSRGKIDNINSIYGIKVFGKGEKPTNGELIALISDKLIIESGL